MALRDFLVATLTYKHSNRKLGKKNNGPQELKSYYNFDVPDCIVVVITDGQPHLLEKTKRIIKQVSKNIKVLGIGIQGIPEELMEGLFPTYYMFDSESANLERDLTNLILEALDQKERISRFKKSWELK